MAATRRVLLVLAHGGAGGMQVQVSLLARSLRAEGADVAVASGPGPLEVGDVEVHRLPPWSPTTALGFASALRRVARGGSFDVLHGHGLRLAPALRASRAPSIVTCHGLDPTRARRTAAMVRLTGVRVATCGDGPRRLLASHGLASIVLDNAVPPMPEPLGRDEVAARLGVTVSDLLVVSPARLSPQKDPCTLVRALSRTSDVGAALVGGGPLLSEVRGEVARLGLDDRVRVLDWSPDARALLAGADVLALASVWEGQPTVVLEAMAAGVAVVATSCVGTRDTLVDGVTGLLAPPRDDARLAARLDEAKDPSVRARVADAARASLALHEPAVVARAHLAAYERLLQRGAARR